MYFVVSVRVRVTQRVCVSMHESERNRERKVVVSIHIAENSCLVCSLLHRSRRRPITVCYVKWLAFNICWNFRSSYNKTGTDHLFFLFILFLHFSAQSDWCDLGSFHIHICKIILRKQYFFLSVIPKTILIIWNNLEITQNMQWMKFFCDSVTSWN